MNSLFLICQNKTIRFICFFSFINAGKRNNLEQNTLNNTLLSSSRSSVFGINTLISKPKAMEEIQKKTEQVKKERLKNQKLIETQNEEKLKKVAQRKEEEKLKKKIQMPVGLQEIETFFQDEGSTTDFGTFGNIPKHKQQLIVGNRPKEKTQLSAHSATIVLKKAQIALKKTQIANQIRQQKATDKMLHAETEAERLKEIEKRKENAKEDRIKITKSQIIEKQKKIREIKNGFIELGERKKENKEIESLLNEIKKQKRQKEKEESIQNKIQRQILLELKRKQGQKYKNGLKQEIVQRDSGRQSLAEKRENRKKSTNQTGKNFNIIQLEKTNKAIVDLFQKKINTRFNNYSAFISKNSTEYTTAVNSKTQTRNNSLNIHTQEERLTFLEFSSSLNDSMVDSQTDNELETFQSEIDDSEFYQIEEIREVSAKEEETPSVKTATQEKKNTRFLFDLEDDFQQNRQSNDSEYEYSSSQEDIDELKTNLANKFFNKMSSKEKQEIVVGNVVLPLVEREEESVQEYDQEKTNKKIEPRQKKKQIIELEPHDSVNVLSSQTYITHFLVTQLSKIFLKTDHKLFFLKDSMIQKQNTMKSPQHKNLSVNLVRESMSFDQTNPVFPQEAQSIVPKKDFSFCHNNTSFLEQFEFQNQYGNEHIIIFFFCDKNPNLKLDSQEFVVRPLVNNKVFVLQLEESFISSKGLLCRKRTNYNILFDHTQNNLFKQIYDFFSQNKRQNLIFSVNIEKLIKKFFTSGFLCFDHKNDFPVCFEDSNYPDVFDSPQPVHRFLKLKTKQNIFKNTGFLINDVDSIKHSGHVEVPQRETYDLQKVNYIKEKKKKQIIFNPENIRVIKTQNLKQAFIIKQITHVQVPQTETYDLEQVSYIKEKQKQKIFIEAGLPEDFSGVDLTSKNQGCGQILESENPVLSRAQKNPEQILENPIKQQIIYRLQNSYIEKQPKVSQHFNKKKPLLIPQLSVLLRNECIKFFVEKLGLQDDQPYYEQNKAKNVLKKSQPTQASSPILGFSSTKTIKPHMAYVFSPEENQKKLLNFLWIVLRQKNKKIYKLIKQKTLYNKLGLFFFRVRNFFINVFSQIKHKTTLF